MFKKIKKGIQRNFKRFLISFCAIVSAMVIFIIPVSAEEIYVDYTVQVMDSFHMWNDKGYGEPYFITKDDIVYINDGTHTLFAAEVEIPAEYRMFSYVMQAQKILNTPIEDSTCYLKLPIFYTFPYQSDTFEELKINELWIDLSLIGEDGSTLHSYDLNIKSDLRTNYIDVGVLLSNLVPFDSIQNLEIQFKVDIDTSHPFLFWFGFYDDIAFYTGTDIPSYSPPDSGSIDNYNNVEQSVVDGTSQGMKEAEKLFNSTSTIFDGSSVVSKSILAATKIFNEFLNVDVFGSVVQLSLILGVFAFLLGVVPSLYSSFMSKEHREYSAHMRNIRIGSKKNKKGKGG